MILQNPDLESLKKYKKWLATAKPNDKYTYYEGFCVHENIHGLIIRNEAYKDARKGLVYLTRKKLKHETFEYIAIKASNVPVLNLIPRY